MATNVATNVANVSGIGMWYGPDESDSEVLEDLLKDCRFDEYDWDVTAEELLSGEIDTPISVIARDLPITLASNPWIGADGRLID